MHLVHLFEQSFFNTINQVIQVSFIGFTLGTLYLVTHSIYFPIVLHATLDLVPFILIDTSGGSSDNWMSTFVYSLIDRNPHFQKLNSESCEAVKYRHQKDALNFD